MMKKLKYLTYIVILILVALLLGRAGIIAVNNGNYFGDKDSPYLREGTSIGQDFNAPTGFSAVGIKINNFGFKDVGILKLGIYDEPKGKKVTEVIRNDRTFPEGEIIMFSFTPLPAGRYYFELAGSDPVGKPPAVKMVTSDKYNEGTVYINGKKGSGDLWFQAYKRYPFVSFLGLVSKRLSSDWFKFIPKAAYLLLFGAYIVLMVVLTGYALNLRNE